MITTAYGISKKVSLDYRYLLCLSFLNGELAITHGYLVITDLELENVEYMTILIKYICTSNSEDDTLALKPDALKSDGQGIEVKLPGLTKLLSAPRIHCFKKKKITNRNTYFIIEKCSASKKGRRLPPRILSGSLPATPQQRTRIPFIQLSSWCCPSNRAMTPSKLGIPMHSLNTSRY